MKLMFGEERQAGKTEQGETALSVPERPAEGVRQDYM